MTRSLVDLESAQGGVHFDEMKFTGESPRGLSLSTLTTELALLPQSDWADGRLLELGAFPKSPAAL